MAALVSHAMRRFPSTPPDTSYSSYRLKGEASRPSEGVGESALSRSMRYADPWLHNGGVGAMSPMAATGLFLAPALVLCVCPDYINGTKRSTAKKGPIMCKKCKGTRLPLTTLESSYKFGTVRCYPTSGLYPTTNGTLRAGTVRVTSSSRPSILPATAAAQDPYDLMRRSRLTVQEAPDPRTRSVSPKKGGAKGQGTSKAKSSKQDPYTTSIFGRRSILECDINPYELVSMTQTDKLKDASITLVNGQRIRVRSAQNGSDEYELNGQRVKVRSAQNRSEVNNHRVRVRSSQNEDSEYQDANPYEDVQVKQGKVTPQSNDKENGSSKESMLPSTKPLLLKSPMTSPQLLHKDLNGRFKSILKKPTSFGDSDVSYTSLESSPSSLRKHGSQKSTSQKSSKASQFYLPMPCSLPRKKVQFLVENEVEREKQVEAGEMVMLTSRTNENTMCNGEIDGVQTASGRGSECEKTEKFEEGNSKRKKIVTLKRSFSDSIMLDKKRTSITNTMPIRRGKIKPRLKMSPSDLDKLDGTVPRTRKSGATTACVPRPTLKTNTTTKEFPKTAKQSSAPGEVKTSVCTESETSPYSEKTESPTQLGSSSQKEITQIDEQILIEKLDKCLMKQDLEEHQLDPQPPLAPPRKKSNSKPPLVVESNSFDNTDDYQSVLETSVTSRHLPVYNEVPINKSPTHTLRVEYPMKESQNRTVVQVNGSPAVHKIQIKNEYADVSNIQSFPVPDNPQRKTSILINGDNCYSTVNVNDNVPLYQSSVVVKDFIVEEPQVRHKKSSTIYITGTFEANQHGLPDQINGLKETDASNQDIAEDVATKGNIGSSNKIESQDKSSTDDSIQQSSELLRDLLRDPVEAVRRNLVPHICGKSDVPRRPRDRKLWFNKIPNGKGEEPLEAPLDEKTITQNSLEESFLRLRNYEAVCDDVSSEHSSSTQYELMDPGSDCYTDHSNRSSVTEEEMAHRTKFYELLAESALVEVSESEDHQYESIKMNNDPIYEEIEIPPPLPSNPPPPALLDDLNLDKEFTTRSIFEGASKYDILSYLVDAKERGIVQEDSYTFSFNHNGSANEEDVKEAYNRVSQLSTVSDSSEDNSLIISGTLIDDKAFQKNAEVERNDSGVGSETSKSSLSKYRTKQEVLILCEDCETTLESKTDNESMTCRKCLKRRSERKEIITEIVETEEKYSRDLQIILEEFYQPMLVAGLLTPEQLSAIFLNVEELLENSQALAERLRDAVEIALEQGDDDLLTVNIGKLFLEATPMLHAFETYCIRQGSASLLLASLEKEKELLRIFLRVSQMENTMLRRMNLNSFLMVPVQRVTKYPLLLARLYKVTPSHHDNRDELKESQHKIELHLNHMNSETKDVPSKLWRRIGSNSGRRSSAEMDLVNIKLRKIAVDVLEWNHEEAKFVLEGKLLFTQPTDNNWRKGRTIKLTPINALLVINGKPSLNKLSDRSDENGLIFSKSVTKEAALLLVRDKNGRYSLLREPLYLDRCVIAADPAWQSYFEVQELLGKDTFIFKAEDEEHTQIWYKQLQFHAQGMGAWRKRRNALANIMINGMGLRS